jgi:hypothetical protein
MLAPHPIIPLVESNAMVIDRSSSVDCALEVSIPLVFVKLKLQGFHASYDSRNG